MLSRFVYHADERLSEAELSAACLDGDVVALGEAYVPADVVETAALRAATLAGMLGTALAATHLSAAWVHGGLDTAPSRHCVQRAVPWRLHHVIGRRFVYRDGCIDPDDLLRVGGATVTTVARTVADLARTPGPLHDAALAEWAAREPAVLDAALAWLAERPQLPSRRIARDAIAAVRTT